MVVNIIVMMAYPLEVVEREVAHQGSAQFARLLIVETEVVGQRGVVLAFQRTGSAQRHQFEREHRDLAAIVYDPPRPKQDFVEE